MARRDLPLGWTWEDVLARLGEHIDVDASAHEHGAIKRRREIRSGAQLLRLVLAYALSGLSLRSTAAWAEAVGEASLSDVALLKRLRGCGPWLAAMVSRLGAELSPEGAAAEGERRIVAVDATTVCSPGGLHKSYQVLHTVYDVGEQHFRTTQVTDRHVAERLDLGCVERGEIRLGDRVYGRYADLAAVTTVGADYVVRLSAIALRLTRARSNARDTPRIDVRGRPLRRAALCRLAERRGVQDLAVQVHGGKGDMPLKARLIVLPMPAAQAEAARRRMRKNARRWGYTASADALATAGCLMLITSLPAKQWPAERVLALYRRRWQVELAFKRLKSLLDLESLRAFDDGLVNAWIHAVLLVAMLIDLERPATDIAAPDSPRREDDVPSPCGASLPSSLAA
jgi:IS4 transposase